MYYVSFRKVRALHPPRSRSLLARCDCGGVRPRSHRVGLAQLAEHTQGGAWTEFGCPHAPLWAVRGASVFCFLFWPRWLSFWRWHPLRAGDRGAASCGASMPTQPPSAINGSLRLRVSSRAFARCGRPGHVGRFQGLRRLFSLAGRPGCPGATGSDRCAGAGTRDNNPRGYREAMDHAVAPRREQPSRRGAARAEQHLNAAGAQHAISSCDRLIV
jgi:hypothetical protein